MVLWLLKHDLLHTLHLRIRIVATTELKARVRQAHERKLERQRGIQHRGRRGSGLRVLNEDLVDYDNSLKKQRVTWLPRAHHYSKRMSSVESELSKASEMSMSSIDEDDEEGTTEESDDENVGWGSAEDTFWPTLISDPGTASPLERRWLASMSEGKEEHIARRFEQ